MGGKINKSTLSGNFDMFSGNFKNEVKGGVPVVAQWDKDLAVTLLWLWLLQRCRFDPWPGNFCMLGVWPKKQK